MPPEWIGKVDKLTTRWIDSIIGDGDYDSVLIPGDLTGVDS